MRILALDPAIHLGWAFDSTEEGVPVGGTHLLPEPTGSKAEGRDRGKTLSTLRAWVIARIDELRPTFVVKERPLNLVMMSYRGRRIGTNRDTIELQCGMGAIIEEACYERHVPIGEFDADDIKKYAGGKRGSDKEPTMRFCTLFNWSYDDDNTADAKVLWSLSKATLQRGWSPARAKGADIEPLMPR